MSRIGVFGGTFDPVHVGHLAAAVNVRYSLSLDRLLLVVANIPWQKADGRGNERGMVETKPQHTDIAPFAYVSPARVAPISTAHLRLPIDQHNGPRIVTG